MDLKAGIFKNYLDSRKGVFRVSVSIRSCKIKSKKLNFSFIQLYIFVQFYVLQFLELGSPEECNSLVM